MSDVMCRMPCAAGWCVREADPMEQLFKTVQQQKEIPLSEKVARQISELIKERNIGIGDKLPNEFELAENLNVGRGTIREAVKLLVARNCLEIRRGKGTYVTEEIGRVSDPLGFDYITDKVRLAEDLYEIRMQMEPWIAALAARQIREEEKEELRRRCDAVEEKILAGEDHYEADNAFHKYIAECTHNSVLPEIIPIITYSVQLFTRYKDPALLKSTRQLHRAIAEAICAHDGAKAEQYMREHILGNRQNIEQLRETTDAAAEG